MTKERKKIVERLRAEGEAAYHAGKSFGSNPYNGANDMDWFQWACGWQNAADAEAAAIADAEADS